MVSSIAQLLIYCAITGISPISSSRISRKFILSLVPEGAGTICELGAGWGSLAFPLAKQSKQFGDERVLAIELSSLPWLYVKLRSLIFRRPNLDIVRANEILVVTVANSTPKPIPVEAISTEAPHDSINIPYTVETQA